MPTVMTTRESDVSSVLRIMVVMVSIRATTNGGIGRNCQTTGNFGDSDRACERTICSNLRTILVFQERG